jgi:hypothetical protein
MTSTRMARRARFHGSRSCARACSGMALPAPRTTRSGVAVRICGDSALPPGMRHVAHGARRPLRGSRMTSSSTRYGVPAFDGRFARCEWRHSACVEVGNRKPWNPANEKRRPFVRCQSCEKRRESAISKYARRAHRHGSRIFVRGWPHTHRSMPGATHRPDAVTRRVSSGVDRAHRHGRAAGQSAIEQSVMRPAADPWRWSRRRQYRLRGIREPKARSLALSRSSPDAGGE